MMIPRLDIDVLKWNREHKRKIKFDKDKEIFEHVEFDIPKDSK